MRKARSTAALQLHGTVDIDAIASITLDTYWVAKRMLAALCRCGNLDHARDGRTRAFLYPRSPRRCSTATFRRASFTAERIADPRLRVLMGKIEVRVECRAERDVPGGLGDVDRDRDAIRERNVAEVKYFKGMLNLPLTDAEVEAKFRRLVQGAFPTRNRPMRCCARCGGWTRSRTYAGARAVAC